MKTITRTITLYTAAELKQHHPKAFDKAREKYNDTTGYDWWDSTFDDFLAIAALMGFTICRNDVRFSMGSPSGGDGASFTGSAQFAPDALEKVTAYAPNDSWLYTLAGSFAEYGKAGIRARITRTSHWYSHPDTVQIEAYSLATAEDICDDLAEGDEIPLDDTPHTSTGWNGENVADSCRDLMTWLYGQLEKEYRYRSGEECFLETAEANEWTFTAEGEIDNE